MHEKPPSTETSDPVTNFEASEANHNTAPTNSDGSPNLFMGVWFKI